MAALKPPAGLGTEGRKLFQAITKDYTFDDAVEKLAVLEIACRAADTAARAQAVIDASESLRTKGSAQQWVAIPELDVARHARTQMMQALRQLELPADEDSQLGPMSRQQSARVAARARWSRSG
jgi:hypothetical protein